MSIQVPPDSRLVARFASWSVFAGIAGIAVGSAVLGAWSIHAGFSGSPQPSGCAIKASAALVFMLAGTALLLMRSAPQARRMRLGGRTCAAAVLLIGSMTLIQYGLDWSSGVDLPAFDAQILGGVLSEQERMTPSSALNACLLGAALLLLLGATSGRRISIGQLLAMAAALISLTALVQYGYGPKATWGRAEFLVMSINSAPVFLVLCVGILFVVPDRGMIARLTGTGIGGTVLRRFVPAVLAILTVSGWLNIEGQAVGLFGPGFGSTLLLAVIAAATTAMLWFGAASLDRADAARRQAEEGLRELNARLEERIATRTAQLEQANRQLKDEIAGHRLAKEELRASEEGYRFLFDSNPLPLWVLDHESLRFTGVNQAAIDKYGYSREEFLSMTSDDIRPAADIARLQAYYSSVPQGQHTKGQWRHLKRDGTMIDVEVFHHVVTYGGRPMSIALALDITERRKAERALHEYTGRLRTLSQQLLNAQETERSRIARELHDQMGQTLTAVKLRLQNMRGAVGATARRAQLEDCIQLTGEVLDQVRGLSLDLRPPLLQELGLVAALDAHVHGLMRRTGMAARFEADAVPAGLAPDIATACFRVVQEALTNALRHAQAKQITVELRCGEGALRLQIDDDGIGFDPDKTRRNAMAGNSIGLLSMAERMTLVGGGCEIVSRPGCGTSVRASVPLAACGKSA